eukprot:TRINITY_DN5559_c0_g1_i1.p1 TRINITY_DN5559_c0_g1~~TRINITY_DN5559_c0_g1_i1.p1  ORF type:complete len:750 (-),score=45.07 TRINITY_DN5559_c0_g1_i1:48-2267(-)
MKRAALPSRSVQSPVQCLAFLEGTTFVCGTESGNISLFTNWEIAGTVAAHSAGGVSSLCGLSATSFASGGFDGCIRLWVGLNPHRCIAFHTGAVTSLRALPCLSSTPCVARGGFISSSQEDGCVVLWSATGECLRSFHHYVGVPVAMPFGTRPGQRFCVGIDAHTGPIRWCQMLSAAVVSGGEDGFIRFWDQYGNCTCELKPTTQTSGMCQMTTAATGLILTLHVSGEVGLWDEIGTDLGTAFVSEKPLCLVRVGHRVVFGHATGKITAWDIDVSHQKPWQRKETALNPPPSPSSCIESPFSLPFPIEPRTQTTGHFLLGDSTGLLWIWTVQDLTTPAFGSDIVDTAVPLILQESDTGSNTTEEAHQVSGLGDPLEMSDCALSPWATTACAPHTESPLLVENRWFTTTETGLRRPLEAAVAVRVERWYTKYLHSGLPSQKYSIARSGMGWVDFTAMQEVGGAKLERLPTTVNTLLKEVSELERHSVPRLEDRQLWQFRQQCMRWAYLSAAENSFCLTRLPQQDSEFLRVKDLVERHVIKEHGLVLHCETVDRVCNPALEFAFWRRRAQLHDPRSEPVEKFHGTRSGCAVHIAANGFRLPDAGERPRHGAMFGKGLYFASDSSKAQLYCRDEGRMLLCRVLLGKTLTVESKNPRLSFDVLRQYDSVFAPRQTKDRSGVYNDEFVLFHPHQALPQYVIGFSTKATTPDYLFSQVSMLPTPSSTMTNNITLRRNGRRCCCIC